jgi:hypothetical protein
VSRPAWSVVLVLAVARPAVAAGPAAADLFPPDTLVYAEVRDPAKLAPQATAALAGSPLEDVVRLVHSRRDAAKTANDIVGKPELAVLGLLASPEAAAEFGKLGGVAAGLTGFNTTGDPEGAVAVLTGDSAAAALAARGFLSLAQVRRVAEVDGVAVYQFRAPQFTVDQNTGQQKLDNEKPPAEGPYEATAAFTPGLFVYGTSKAAVGAVLTRFRGKGGAGLGASAPFKAAREKYPGPGLFVYADAAALVAKLDAVRQEGDGGPEPDPLGWFRLLANEKAVRHVVGSVRFRDGGLAVELSAVVTPGAPSPLAALLAGPGVKADLLAHSPVRSAVAITLSLPEQGRTAAVVGFLDAAAKAAGELGRSPGQAVKDWEAKFKTPVADGLIGKTRAVAVFLPQRPTGGKDAARPVLVLHADTAEAAAAWEEFVPKLLADLGGNEPAQPSSEPVDGVKVLSLPGADLPWRAAVHYARKGAVLAVGFDRAQVAAAVKGGDSVAPPNPPVALVGSARLGGALAAVLNPATPAGPVVPLPNQPPLPRSGFGPRSGPVGVEGGPPAAGQQKAEEKALTGVWAALDALPPAALTARRDGDELRVGLVQPVGKDGFAPVVAAAVGWFDAYLGRNPNQSFGPYSGPRFR